MRRGRLTINFALLAGALLLSFAFGSLHAFGALLRPLEVWLHASRGNVSLGYSLAIVALTGGVLLGPCIAALLGTLRTALACGALGALGLALPAMFPETAVFLLGYGIVFGFGNGVAYGLSLERAAAAVSDGKGIAIGAATSVYGCGAAVFAQIVGPVATGYSVGAALWLMALAVGAAGLSAAAAFAVAPLDAPPSAVVRDAATEIGARDGVLGLGRLWLVYFLGACGGLMVTAHALGILTEARAAVDLARHAVTLNAVGNIIGSALGGILADRLRPTRALAVPLLLSMAAMSGLLATKSGFTVLAMLALCGFAYGALIAAVPVVIRNGYGASGFGKAFGIVFTAWGGAGLAGPYLAGLLYDLRQNYSVAIAAATGCALAALVLIATKPVSQPRALPRD